MFLDIYGDSKALKEGCPAGCWIYGTRVQQEVKAGNEHLSVLEKDGEERIAANELLQEASRATEKAAPHPTQMASGAQPANAGVHSHRISGVWEAKSGRKEGTQGLSTLKVEEAEPSPLTLRTFTLC